MEIDDDDGGGGVDGGGGDDDDYVGDTKIMTMMTSTTILCYCDTRMNCLTA